MFQLLPNVKQALTTPFLWLIFIDGCCNPYVFKPNHCKRRRAKIDWPSSYTGKIVNRVEAKARRETMFYFNLQAT